MAEISTLKFNEGTPNILKSKNKLIIFTIF